MVRAILASGPFRESYNKYKTTSTDRKCLEGGLPRDAAAIPGSSRWSDTMLLSVWQYVNVRISETHLQVVHLW